MMTPPAARAAILIVELATFFIGTVFASYFLSYAAAIEFAPGEQPPPHFPVLVYESERAPAGSGSHRVVAWNEWEKLAAARPAASLLLPQPSATVALPDGAQASYTAASESATRQAIELTWRSGNGEQAARYIAEARRMEPRHLRLLSAQTLLTSAIAAFVASLFLGRSLRRRWIAQPGYFG